MFILLAIIAVALLLVSTASNVHLYAGNRPAGEAMFRFKRGTQTLSDAKGSKIHFEDVPYGYRITVHGPKTGTKAITVK